MNRQEPPLSDYVYAAQRKVRSYVGLVAGVIVLAYILTYVQFRQSHMERREADGHYYVIYPIAHPLIYRIHRPLMYLDGAVTGMRFHIGPHPESARGSYSIPADKLTLLRSGDIIFQTSRSSQSRAIQIATNSKYSHMGLVEVTPTGTFVIEAIQPVTRTPINHWISRGVDGHFVVKRLDQSVMTIDTTASRRLIAAALVFQGKGYDSYFGWSDDLIYCSEIVWKAYDRGLGIQLGTLRRLRDFDLTNPAVAAKLRERYGSRIPLDEVVIAPSDIFNCPKLVTVTEG